MIFHVLTLFPEMIEQAVSVSILKRAAESGKITVHAVNIRDFSADKHHSVDDYPYGGGAGMVMQAQPVYDAWKSVCEGATERRAKADITREDHFAGTSESGGVVPLRTVYLTPQGRTLTQEIAHEFSAMGADDIAGEKTDAETKLPTESATVEPEIILLCGHYEGIDERVLEEIVTDEISIGDYVLTGGELPALVFIDAVARLIPGVLHNDESANTESFENGLLEYPQYSRPEVWHERAVPPILLSGDHAKVDAWRHEQAVLRTKAKRPDLLM